MSTARYILMNTMQHWPAFAVNERDSAAKLNLNLATSREREVLLAPPTRSHQAVGAAAHTSSVAQQQNTE